MIISHTFFSQILINMLQDNLWYCVIVTNGKLCTVAMHKKAVEKKITKVSNEVPTNYVIQTNLSRNLCESTSVYVRMAEYIDFGLFQIFLFFFCILRWLHISSYHVPISHVFVHGRTFYFQIIFATLLAVCNCAKLDNTYLPPQDAQSSGGNFGLAPPNQSNGNGNNGFNGNNGNGFGQQNPQQGFAPQNPQQGFGGGNQQPQESQQPPIAILSYENEPNYGDGSYKYSYETGMLIDNKIIIRFCVIRLFCGWKYTSVANCGWNVNGFSFLLSIHFHLCLFRERYQSWRTRWSEKQRHWQRNSIGSRLIQLHWTRRSLVYCNICEFFFFFLSYFLAQTFF